VGFEVAAVWVFKSKCEGRYIVVVAWRRISVIVEPKRVFWGNDKGSVGELPGILLGRKIG
jgi:hypothetical protein